MKMKKKKKKWINGLMKREETSLLKFPTGESLSRFRITLIIPSLSKRSYPNPRLNATVDFLSTFAIGLTHVVDGVLFVFTLTSPIDRSLH